MDGFVIQFLNKTGKFSKEDAILLEQELRFREIKKEEFLLEQGDICSSLFFVISGCFYQYNFDSELNQNIIDLNIPNDCVISHTSFLSRKPSEFSIQAFKNSTVLELSLDAIHKLIAHSPAFLQMGRLLDESTSRIRFFDNNNSPDEKYKYIIEHKPGLLQMFSQKVIASYLKITPETFSRVRKRI